MTTNAAHRHQDNTKLQQLLVQRDAQIARQSAELQARDLLIEKLKLQLVYLRVALVWGKPASRTYGQAGEGSMTRQQTPGDAA